MTQKEEGRQTQEKELYGYGYFYLLSTDCFVVPPRNDGYVVGAVYF